LRWLRRAIAVPAVARNKMAVTFFYEKNKKVLVNVDQRRDSLRLFRIQFFSYSSNFLIRNILCDGESEHQRTEFAVYYK